jgi:hypothetical protein
LPVIVYIVSHQVPNVFKPPTAYTPCPRGFLESLYLYHMEDILLQQSEWENYAAAPASLLKLMKEKFPGCTYVPSAEMLSAIKAEYSNSVIQIYANGPDFTAYRVYISERDALQMMLVELNNEDDAPLFFESEEEYRAYLDDEAGE